MIHHQTECYINLLVTSLCMLFRRCNGPKLLFGDLIRICIEYGCNLNRRSGSNIFDKINYGSTARLLLGEVK